MVARKLRWLAGFRRFTSDYGFMGFVTNENAARALSFMLHISATLSISVTSLVWYLRFSNVENYEKSLQEVGSIRAGSFGADHGLHRVKNTLPALLPQFGLTFDDWLVAASRFTPLEWDILYTVTNHVTSLEPDVSLSLSQESRERELISPDQALDIITEEQLKNILTFLINRWKTLGYFDKVHSRNRAIFGQRQTAEAVGVDIDYTIVPSFTNTRNANRLSYASTMRAADQLQQFGFTIVRAALSTEHLDELRSALQLSRGPALEVGERIVQMDTNISHNRANPNRLSLLLRGSKLDSITQYVHNVPSHVIPCVMGRMPNVQSRLIVSDVRLIVVDHAAQDGNWTLYNPKGGYSMLIPLHDRDWNSGSRTVLPFSQYFTDSSRSCASRLFSFFKSLPQLARPLNISSLYANGCWNAGDALIYDNRLLIKESGNKTFKSGTYILVKYEPVDSLDVGLYLPGKVYFRLAALLEKVSSMVQ